MKNAWIILVSLLAILLVGLLIMFGGDPGGVEVGSRPTVRPPDMQPIRIGLVPERDIFALRKRNRVLADYLQTQLGRPVELVTASSYAGILRDFQEKQVDAAFLGSLVAALAVDRMNAQIVLKTELPGGISTYHGVICVREDSPIRDVDELAGRSLAVVRTTTGGNLFPLYCLAEHGIVTGGQRPRLVWVGTHDDAVAAVMRGEVDAAGVKDLRLKALVAANPAWKVRVLATSDPVPENALVVRGDVADTVGKQIVAALLKIDQTPEGRAAMKQYGAERFLPCGTADFKAIYDIVERLGPAWPQVGIDGPAPRRPGEGR